MFSALYSFTFKSKVFKSVSRMLPMVGGNIVIVEGPVISLGDPTS